MSYINSKLWTNDISELNYTCHIYMKIVPKKINGLLSILNTKIIETKFQKLLTNKDRNLQAPKMVPHWVGERGTEEDDPSVGKTVESQ